MAHLYWLRIQLINARQISVDLGIIKAVAHKKPLGIMTDIVRFHLDFTPLSLVD
jgi:hypothetical protein